MNWISQILIAIAASNTFGAINFYLKSYGILIDHYRLIKPIVMFLAYLIAVLAYRGNSLAVLCCYLFLVSGLTSAMLAVYTGIQLGAIKTLVLAIFWFLSFCFAVYVFYKHNFVVKTDRA